MLNLILCLGKGFLAHEKKISSLEKIGYLKTLPKDADINDYESLLISEKDGKTITLYILA